MSLLTPAPSRLCSIPAQPGWAALVFLSSFACYVGYLALSCRVQRLHPQPRLVKREYREGIRTCPHRGEQDGDLRLFSRLCKQNRRCAPFFRDHRTTFVRIIFVAAEQNMRFLERYGPNPGFRSSQQLLHGLVGGSERAFHRVTDELVVPMGGGWFSTWEWC